MQSPAERLRGHFLPSLMYQSPWSALREYTNSATCAFLHEDATLAIRQGYYLESSDSITENSRHFSDQLAILLRTNVKNVVDYAVRHMQQLKAELSSAHSKTGEVLQRLELSEARSTIMLLDQQQQIISLTSLLVQDGKEPLSCVRCRQSLPQASHLEEHRSSATCIDQYEFQVLYAFFILGYKVTEIPWVLQTFRTSLHAPLSYHFKKDEDKEILFQMASGRLRKEWTIEWIDTMGRKEPRLFELYRDLKTEFPKPGDGVVKCLMCSECFRKACHMWAHVKEWHRDHILWGHFCHLLDDKAGQDQR